MSKQRGWILLSLGVLLALGTGVAVFFLLRQQQQAANERAIALAAQQSVPVATLQLPVAARPLSPGTLVSAEDFQLKDFPVDLVPVAAITSSVTLENQVIVEPIGQGETFSMRQLAGQSAEQVSRQLPEGQIAFAYPIQDLMSQLQVVEPGDRIDLLITLDVASPDGATAGPVTAFTLQNILVFDVIRPGAIEDNNPPIAMLLSLTPDEALIVKHVKDSNGDIDFILRSVLDTEEFDVTPIDREELLSRYGMR